MLPPTRRLTPAPTHASAELISPGRSFTSFTTISPNSVFAHANHDRVNFAALSLSNDSCINPVPAVVSRSQRRHCLISRSSVEVNARYIIDIGHTIFNPSCGPPTPSAALPRKKYGFDSLSTNSRVRLYCASSNPQQPRYGKLSNPGAFASSIINALPYPSTSYAHISPNFAWCTLPCISSARSTSAANSSAAAASFLSLATCVANSANCRKLTTAKRFAGTNSG